MSGRSPTPLVFLVLLLLLLPLSCTRIQKPATSGDTALPTEQLTSLDAIPADWGELVSVSAPPGWSDALLLWFEDADGTIRAVLYNATTAQLARDARVIRRN